MDQFTQIRLRSMLTDLLEPFAVFGKIRVEFIGTQTVWTQTQVTVGGVHLCACLLPDQTAAQSLRMIVETCGPSILRVAHDRGVPVLVEAGAGTHVSAFLNSLNDALGA